jgi:hypothetical protein
MYPIPKAIMRRWLFWSTVPSLLPQALWVKRRIFEGEVAAERPVPPSHAEIGV